MKHRWIPLTSLILLALSLGWPNALKQDAAAVRPSPTPQEKAPPQVRRSQLEVDFSQGVGASLNQNIQFVSEGLTTSSASEVAIFISRPIKVPLDEVAPFLAVAAVWSAATAADAGV